MYKYAKCACVDENRNEIPVRLKAISLVYLNNREVLPEGGSILSQLGSALSGSWELIFQRLAQAIGALPPVRNIALDIGAIEVYR